LVKVQFNLLLHIRQIVSGLAKVLILSAVHIRDFQLAFGGGTPARRSIQTYRYYSLNNRVPLRFERSGKVAGRLVDRGEGVGQGG
jgi:hypothetical protein